MDPLVLIADYLSDLEIGMKNFITGFLNHVMLAEALQQAGATPYEHTDVPSAHRATRTDRSRPGTEKRCSGNPGSASSRSRRRSSGAMPG